MKTFFKIISLLLVVAAVAVAIIFTQESVNEYRAYKTIMPFDFKKYVTDKVDNDIKGSDASKVRPSYVSIYDIITTESSIESNSDSLVSDDVITQCYEHAFMAYWKILDEELDRGVPGNYFEREKQVAIMFGFESFECEAEPAKTGDFGYYMMRTEL